MLKIREHRDNRWYDFIDAQKDNFHPLAKKLKIDPYIQKKFLTETNRDKAVLLGDNLYISLHFPDLKHKEYVSQEIKFIIGRNYILTNHLIENEGLDKFRKLFESDTAFENDSERDSCIVYIFIHMIEKIYENIIFELRKLEEQITEIENNIFLDKEKQMVRKISETNRDLLDFKRNIRTHREAWNIFFKLSKEYFTKESSYTAIESILISYEKAEALSNELSDMVHELRDTNNSLLSTKQNEIMKVFTLITFLTFPPTLFFTIISLPTKEKHIFNYLENDFTIIMTIAAILFLVMFSITIWKKWW